MRHLSESVLRRLYDEPAAIPAAARRHYATCARCRGRFDTIAADARAVAPLLAVSDARADPAAAFTQIRQRIAAQNGVQSRRRHQRWYERMGAMVQLNGRRLARPVGGVIAAAALVGALALTPAGSFAQSFITIFEPQQFVPVPVTSGELQSLPNLRDYGTMTQSAQPAARQVASATAAAAATGLVVHAPASLPAGVPTNVTYTVLSQGTASFTFSAARAQAAAAATGKTLPPMPAGLDGSTLQVTIGPAVVATYGGTMGIGGEDTRLRGRHAGIKGVATGRAAVHREGDMPSLVVAEAAQPRITSTGATAKEIEDYLLAQPGVSPQLAAEIKAIGDPTTALPIPIPVERATAQTVQVQGTSGLAVGDNTGIGSGVIWEKDGVVYGVAGALPESQILAIANSLQ
jgi:hypothetical protein